jgi:predicted phage-related endonuclease
MRVFARQAAKKGVQEALKGAAKQAAKQAAKNFTKISDQLLKKSRIDAHQLKKDFLGNKAKISRYDLYKDTNTGEILILQKGGIGSPIRTGEFIFNQP